MTTSSLITMDVKDAKEEFSELISRVAHNKDRIILTRRGKDIAAIISLEDLSLLEESKSKNDLEEAVEALKEVRDQGSMTLENLKNEMGDL